MFLYSAEKAVNERLAHTLELYLLALAHFAIAADTEVVSPILGMHSRKDSASCVDAIISWGPLIRAERRVVVTHR